MSIPFNDNLLWKTYTSNPTWHENPPKLSAASSPDSLSEVKRAVNALFVQTSKEVVKRSVQFIRDGLRLVLKVPIRSIWTPIVLPKNWKERERALINVKLTGYSFVQLVAVPLKFLVALAALAAVGISVKRAHGLLNESERWTAHLDGRASQLEALKEVGGKNALNQTEYDQYKNWLYSIDPKICRKAD